MSAIDSKLSPALRQEYLNEVRNWLPAFLVGASSERTQPLKDVTELLALDRRDLRRTIAVHLLLQEPAQKMLSELKIALRSPDSSSIRPPEVSRAVTGGIDWAGTSRIRSTSSPIEPLFVIRKATRDFDTAANRVLAWVIRTLLREFRLSGLLASQTRSDSWRTELSHQFSRLDESARTPWIRALRITRPSEKDFDSLRDNRKRFYRESLSDIAQLLKRFEDPPISDVVDLLTRRWFEPDRDWALFELVVLLKCERALAGRGTRERLGIAGAGRGPFAQIRLASGSLVRVWYQAWPPSTAPSELLDAIGHYGLNSGGSRPDAVVEYLPTNGAARCVLLEMKSSESGEYLASGFLQLLGYLRERPTGLAGESRGWLVAPESSPLSSAPPAGRSLWATSECGVAAALLERIDSWESELAGK